MSATTAWKEIHTPTVVSRLPLATLQATALIQPPASLVHVDLLVQVTTPASIMNAALTACARKSAVPTSSVLLGAFARDACAWLDAGEMLLALLDSLASTGNVKILARLPAEIVRSAKSSTTKLSVLVLQTPLVTHLCRATNPRKVVPQAMIATRTKIARTATVPAVVLQTQIVNAARFATTANANLSAVNQRNVPKVSCACQESVQLDVDPAMIVLLGKLASVPSAGIPVK